MRCSRWMSTSLAARRVPRPSSTESWSRSAASRPGGRSQGFVPRARDRVSPGASLALAAERVPPAKAAAALTRPGLKAHQCTRSLDLLEPDRPSRVSEPRPVQLSNLTESLEALSQSSLGPPPGLSVEPPKRTKKRPGVSLGLGHSLSKKFRRLLWRVGGWAVSSLPDWGLGRRTRHALSPTEVRSGGGVRGRPPWSLRAS